MKAKCRLASLALASLVACRSPAGPGPIADRWQEIREDTWCFIPNAATYCLGLQGFAVTRDGVFSAGHVVSGRLSTAELSSLRGDLALLDSAFRSECDSQPGHSDFQDEVQLTLKDEPAVRLYSFSEGCYRGGRAQALQVTADMHALMAKYYPIPFPAP